VLVLFAGTVGLAVIPNNRMIGPLFMIGIYGKTICSGTGNGVGLYVRALNPHLTAAQLLGGLFCRALADRPAGSIRSAVVRPNGCKWPGKASLRHFGLGFLKIAI
jgi:hypothetical protein